DYFGVDIISEYYCAGIIALGTMTPISGEKKYNEYIKAETIVNGNITDNKEIIKYSENIKRIILIFKGDDYGELEKNCQIYARRIKDDIEKNTFCDVTISIGCVHQTIQGIAASIKDAEVALDLDKSLCKDGIISLDSKYGCVVSRAKQFINENYSKSGTTLNSVADYVCVSPNHFSAIFSQNTGMTFSEYLTYTRIKKAKELLITTNMKAYEIAFKVGYNDSHYFSNVFKKTVSLSPTDFRVSRKDNMLAYNRQQNTNRL
ncbi:MAG: helix-turn-helix transcriptional regulator, partial [Clostridiales bacterium]|nr:helix-turn-helix transcriptional regulator [Clostridiales bacterium]